MADRSMKPTHVDDGILERFRKLPVATIWHHVVDDAGVPLPFMERGVRTFSPGKRLAARACTLRYLPFRPDIRSERRAPPGEGTPYRAMARCGPGDALVADQIAKSAEFFSFGTNDLTQLTFGYSRDDSGTFLPEYVDKGILPEDPFQSLDQEGVGQLVQLGTERGRATRKNLKVGICGEHGGDPASVHFCHRVGLNYVSCSPYRVPIARLAAAQAALAK